LAQNITFGKIIGSVILVAVTLLFLFLSGWVLLTNRLEVANMVANLLHKPERLDLIANEYLTPQRYRIIQFVSIVAVIISGSFTFLFWRFYKSIAVQAKKVKDEFRRIALAFITTWNTLTGRQKLITWVVFVILLIVKCWFAYTFPAHTDEAYSYVNFVHEGFFKTIAYYPLPNNHVFYNVLCGFFELPDLPPLWVMRLPTFITSLFLSLLSFFICLRRYNFQIGFLAAVFFSAAPYSVYFSVHGRGYILVSFFALAAIYAVLRFLETGRNFYLVLFVLASAFGFFTIPVFAYVFVPLVLFGFFYLLKSKKNNQLLKFFWSAILAGVLTLFFYSLILITSGWRVLFGKDIQAVVNQDFNQKLGPYLSFQLTKFSGWEYIGYLLPVLVLIVLLKDVRNQKEGFLKKVDVYLLSWLFFSPLFLILLSRVLPPERTWLYWTIFCAIIMAGLIAWIFIKLKLAGLKADLVIAFLGLIFIVFQGFNLKNKVSSGEITVFWPLMEIIPEIVNSPAKEVYSEHEYYELYAQFGRLEKNENLHVDVYEFHPEKKYDYVLILKENQFPAALPAEDYELVLTDILIKAYRRKGLR
jgi:hypothetical protein